MPNFSENVRDTQRPIFSSDGFENSVTFGAKYICGLNYKQIILKYSISI